ncbi:MULTISPECIES: host specificity protein J, partial [Pasteurellaceae]
MGGQSGGGGHTPYEAPDSLKSSQRLRAIGLISLGPIKGPVNKWKSTYFDNTPIQKEDGVDDNDEASFNFKNTEIQYNLGTQDQLPLNGFECSEREVNVGVEVKKDHPITRTVIDKDITRVRLTMGVNALFEQNDEGDTNGTDVTFQVLINNADYSTFTISGKSSSRFARSYILTNLPERPFTITVKRITEDSNSQRLQNTTFWSSYTEIIDTKLSYPNMAIVGIKTDSRYNPHFPNVNFLLQGRLVKIPANYDPYTRTYENGLWKGDFKLDWTNNPAWVFYDLVTSKLVGLGARLGEYGVDKFQLYQIAQYCDQLVDDGYGGKEPRMTANLWLTSQRDAYSVLADMASVFRAIVAWNGTQLMATQDRATDPVCTYTQANVVNGKFSRRYVPLKAIYTAVEVEYVDARNRYQKTIEYIADDLMIARYGYNVKKIVAFACTSRGQARRYGKWILETSRLEQCTITFSVGREGLRHLPGDIIEVADNSYANLNLGGRVVAIEERTVTLDRSVELVGESYISYVDYGSENPVLQRVKVLSVDSENDHIIHLDVEPIGLEENCVWALHTQTVQTQLFRALGIAEGEDGSYTITALQHEPQKEAIVDGGASFSSSVSTSHKTPNISHIAISSVGSGTNIEADVSSAGVELTYDIKILKDGNLYDFRKGLKSPELKLNNLPNGDYTAVIYAKNKNGQLLKESSNDFVINKPPRPTAVEITGGLKNVILEWQYVDDTTETEIFVSETDDIKTAKKLAKVTAQMYSHEVGANKVRYYWLRHTRGINNGEFYQNAGLKAQTSVDIDEEIEVLKGKFNYDALINDEVEHRKAGERTLASKITEEATKREQALLVQARTLGTKISNVETATNEQSQQLARLTAVKNNLVTGLEQERQARINGDNAEAQARQTLISQVNTNKASINTLSQTVV